MLRSEENSKKIWLGIAETLAKKVKDRDQVDWNNQFARFMNIISQIESSLSCISFMKITKLREIAGRQVVNDKNSIDWSAYENTEQNMSNLLAKIVSTTLFLSSHDNRTVKTGDRDLADKGNFTYVTNHDDGTYTFQYEKELVAMERYLALTKMTYHRQMNKQEM